MSGIGDALTVGILLTLIFGAVCFYLYSRLSQNEKRTGLLENLFLKLKMTTEASLSGPEIPRPLEPREVESVEETDYSDLLKDIPGPAPISPKPSAPVVEETGVADEVAMEEALRSLEVPIVSSDSRPSLEANYESMTFKELQTLARQKGVAVNGQRKKDLIDALKSQGVAPPPAHIPLTQQEGEFSGSGGEPKEGYAINLEA